MFRRIYCLRLQEVEVNQRKIVQVAATPLEGDCLALCPSETSVGPHCIDNRLTDDLRTGRALLSRIIIFVLLVLISVRGFKRLSL
jgi:hypothetical protein